MKIKEGFIVKQVAGKYVVVSVGEEALNFNLIIHLNESGKLLFETLKEGATEEELIKLLLDTYDVDEQRAKQDVFSFVSILKEKGIL